MNKGFFIETTNIIEPEPYMNGHCKLETLNHLKKQLGWNSCMIRLARKARSGTSK
jgi:hypothetical protein